MGLNRGAQPIEWETQPGYRGSHTRDPLPEYQHYRDDGCSIAPRCLECPLPQCRFDLPPKRAGALMRQQELRSLFAQGLTADEAAAAMGVSRRTVFRLKAYGNERVAGATLTPRRCALPSCGQAFTPRVDKQVFCSRPCTKRAAYERSRKPPAGHEDAQETVEARR